MDLRRPDEETLRAYVYGDLAPAETQALQRWLVAFADEQILSAYERLLAERRSREAVEARWAARPFWARLEHAWERFWRSGRSRWRT